MGFGPRPSSGQGGGGNPFPTGGSSGGRAPLVDPFIPFDADEAEIEQVLRQFDINRQVSDEYAASRILAVQESAQREVNRLEAAGEYGSAEMERLLTIARTGRKQESPSLFGRLLGYLDRPATLGRMATSNFIQLAQGVEQGDELYDFRDGVAALMGRSQSIALRHGSDAGEDGRTSGSTLLDKLGWSKTTNFGNNAARFVASFVAEVATDPLSYVTFGGAGLSKATLGAIFRNSVSTAGKEVAGEVGEAIAKRVAYSGTDDATAMLGRAVTSQADDVIETTADLAQRIVRGEASDLSELDPLYRQALGTLDDSQILEHLGRVGTGQSDNVIRQVMARPRAVTALVESATDDVIDAALPAILARDWAAEALGVWQKSKFSHAAFEGGIKVGIPFVPSDRLIQSTLRTVSAGPTRGAGRKISRALFGQRPSYAGTQQAIARGEKTKKGVVPLAKWLDEGWGQNIRNKWDTFAKKWSSDGYIKGVVRGNLPASSVNAIKRSMMEMEQRLGIKRSRELMNAGIKGIMDGADEAHLGPEQKKQVWRAISDALETHGDNPEEVMGAIRRSLDDIGEGFVPSEQMAADIAGFVDGFSGTMGNVREVLTELGVLRNTLDNYMPHILSKDMSSWMDDAIDMGVEFDPTGNLGDQILAQLADSTNRARVFSEGDHVGSTVFAQERIIGQTVTGESGAELLPLRVGETQLLDRGVLKSYGRDTMTVEDLNREIKAAVEKVTANAQEQGVGLRPPVKQGDDFFPYNADPLETLSTYLVDMEHAAIEASMIQAGRDAGLITDGVRYVNRQQMAARIVDELGPNSHAGRQIEQVFDTLESADQAKRQHLIKQAHVPMEEVEVLPGHTLQLPKDVLARRQTVAAALGRLRGTDEEVEITARHAAAFARDTYSSFRASGHSDEASRALAEQASMREVDTLLRDARQGLREEMAVKVQLLREFYATSSTADIAAASDLAAANQIALNEAMMQMQEARNVMKANFGEFISSSGMSDLNELDLNVLADALEEGRRMDPDQLEDLLRLGSTMDPEEGTSLAAAFVAAAEGISDVDIPRLSRAMRGMADSSRRQSEWLTETEEAHVRHAAQFVNTRVRGRIGLIDNNWDLLDYVDDGSEIFLYHGTGFDETGRLANEFAGGGLSISPFRSFTYMSPDAGGIMGANGRVLVYRLSDMPQGVQDHYRLFMDYKTGVIGADPIRVGAEHNSIDIEDATQLAGIMGTDKLPDPVEQFDWETWQRAVSAVHADTSVDLDAVHQIKREFISGGPATRRDLRESPQYAAAMSAWHDKWLPSMRSGEDLGFYVGAPSPAPWNVSGVLSDQPIHNVSPHVLARFASNAADARDMFSHPRAHGGELEFINIPWQAGDVQDAVQTHSILSLRNRGLIDDVSPDGEITVFFERGSVTGKTEIVSLTPTGSAEEVGFKIKVKDVLVDNGAFGDEAVIEFDNTVLIRTGGLKNQADPNYMSALHHRPGKQQLGRIRPEQLSHQRIASLFEDANTGDRAWADMMYRMSAVQETEGAVEKMFMETLGRGTVGLGAIGGRQRDADLLTRIMAHFQDQERATQWLRRIYEPQDPGAREALQSRELRISVAAEVSRSGGPDIEWIRGKYSPSQRATVLDAEDAEEIWIPVVRRVDSPPLLSRQALETRLDEMGESAASLRRKIATGEVELDDDALLNTVNGMGDELTVLFDDYRVRLDRVQALRGRQVIDPASVMGAKRTRQIGSETLGEAIADDVVAAAQLSGHENVRLVVNPRTGTKYAPVGYLAPMRETESLTVATHDELADAVAGFVRENAQFADRGKTRIVVEGVEDGWRIELMVPTDTARDAELTSMALGARRYVNLRTGEEVAVAPTRAAAGRAGGKATQSQRALDLFDDIEAALRGNNAKQANAILTLSENRAALRTVISGSELDDLTNIARTEQLLSERSSLITQEAVRSQQAFFSRMTKRETGVVQLTGMVEELRRLEASAIDDAAVERLDWLREFVEIMEDVMGVGRERPGAPVTSGLYPIDEMGQVTVDASENYLGRLKVAQNLADNLGFDEWTAGLGRAMDDVPFDIKPPKAPSAQHPFQVFGVDGHITDYAFTDNYTVDMMRSFMRSWQSLNTPVGLDLFRKEMTYVAHAWKSMATVARPTFHVRNLAGGVWNNQIADVRLQDYVWVQGAMMKLRRKMLTMPFDEAIESFSPRQKEVLGAMHEWKVLDLGFSSAEFDKLKTPTKNIFTRISPGHAEFIPTRLGAFGMRTIEDYLRASAFVRWYDQVGPEAAASIVFDIHFDYTDVGQADRLIKKIAPFWIWTKNNIPLQLRVLMERPGLINRYTHLMNAFDDSFRGDEYGDWPNDPYRSELAADTGFTLNGDTPFWAKLIFEPDLPLTDLEVFGNPLSVDTWINAAANTINPVATTPFNFMQSNEYGTTQAPVGMNEAMLLTNWVGLTDNVGQDGRVQVGIGTSQAFLTAFPIISEYSNLLGLQTNPNRRQQLGIVDEDGVSMAERLRGAGITLARGVGLQSTTPNAARSTSAIAQADVYEIVDRLKADGTLTPMDFDTRGLSAEDMERILEILYSEG